MVIYPILRPYPIIFDQVVNDDFYLDAWHHDKELRNENESFIMLWIPHLPIIQKTKKAKNPSGRPFSDWEHKSTNSAMRDLEIIMVWIVRSRYQNQSVLFRTSLKKRSNNCHVMSTVFHTNLFITVSSKHQCNCIVFTFNTYRLHIFIPRLQSHNITLECIVCICFFIPSL